MENVATDLTNVVATSLPRLQSIDESGSGASREPGAWTHKQVLGHLIDSAVNNHQRFVRAQLGKELIFPSYEQDSWLAVQAYEERPWEQLVELWAALNRHVAHVIGRIPSERLQTPCRIGAGEPVTLDFLARDYVWHLRHHLDQILTPAAAVGKKYHPLPQ